VPPVPVPVLPALPNIAAVPPAIPVVPVVAPVPVAFTRFPGDAAPNALLDFTTQAHQKYFSKATEWVEEKYDLATEKLFGLVNVSRNTSLLMVGTTAFKCHTWHQGHWLQSLWTTLITTDSSLGSRMPCPWNGNHWSKQLI
jgi:hypothetical protein